MDREAVLRGNAAELGCSRFDEQPGPPTPRGSGSRWPRLEALSTRTAGQAEGWPEASPTGRRLRQ
jgi:hypothetical protein